MFFFCFFPTQNQHFSVPKAMGELSAQTTRTAMAEGGKGKGLAVGYQGWSLEQKSSKIMQKTLRVGHLDDCRCKQSAFGSWADGNAMIYQSLLPRKRRIFVAQANPMKLWRGGGRASSPNGSSTSQGIFVISVLWIDSRVGLRNSLHALSSFSSSILNDSLWRRKNRCWTIIWDTAFNECIILLNYTDMGTHGSEDQLCHASVF